MEQKCTVRLTTDVSDSVARLPEETLVPSSSTQASVRDFDLNLDLENNGDAAPDTAKTSTKSMISEGNGNMKNDPK